MDFGILGVGSGGRAGPGADDPGILRNNYTLTVVTNDLKVLNTFLFSPDFSVVSGTSEPSPHLETVSPLGFPEPLLSVSSAIGCSPISLVSLAASP